VAKFTTDRMGELQLAGVEVDTPVPVAPPGTVFDITLDRPTRSGQLGPDLVKTTAVCLDAQEVIPVAAAQIGIGQGCFQSLFIIVIGDEGLVDLFGRDQVVFQTPFRRIRHVSGNGEVGLFDLSCLEQFGKFSGDRLAAGQDHQSADRPVQPMDGIEAVMTIFDHEVQEGGITCFVRQDRHAGGFDTDPERIALVQDQLAGTG